MNEKKIFKVFKALGEPSRLKIIKLLSQQSMCVCELSEVLDMSQPRVSQHLRTLKEVDLVYEERQGFWTYYKLDLDEMHKVLKEFHDFLGADLNEIEGYEEIHHRLVNLPPKEEIKNKTK
ncbi:ArsR/SmtB family transcription factor [Natranaerobius thermophilus]|uniref:Transcriptional regulator, ArsR family n=1 Tax=Natranaerobius thermophilus (strain ATCC BAA-1301 / DSM 18059 / JW/NM-WN-LF) TaxID=457570 RepID=B2A7P2_NATTJ|nr:metalloregulator ArsR/SmtB family transcription factor [Natranaerobius thermophilus]ACB84344.1 transcriptional regulator, ArsR family [Natranaerobius thermophilus JW/NM-WN-LF]